MVRLKNSAFLRVAQVYFTKDMGEVWANMLHSLLAELIKMHGWSNNAMKDPSGPEGNVAFMHLLIDALPLQPCNPTCEQCRWLCFLRSNKSIG